MPKCCRRRYGFRSHTPRNVTGDDATYGFDTVTRYKEEANVTYFDEISFKTPASSDDCGVTLTIDEEYLVGLIDSDDNGVYTVSSCHGLYELWSTAVEKEVVECADCAGSCGGELLIP